MKNRKHWRGSAAQNRALEYLDSRTAELMENHVHCLAGHLESLQEEA